MRPSLAPSRTEAADALAILTLVLLGIVGYRAAYGGTAYLAVGALGACLGLLLAHFAARMRRPVLIGAAGSVILAVLLAGVVLRDTAIAGFLPSATSVMSLLGSAVTGWKELLTTVRPVGSARHLLALPYLLGLTTAVAAAGLARRSRHPALPLLPPALLAALGILFGGPTPAAAFLQGCCLTAVAIAWTATRASRGRIALSRSSRRYFRPVAGLTVLVLASAGAWFAGPHAPLAHAHAREVASLQPPFDPGAFASPLGEFRRYTKNSAHPLVNEVLVTVTGAPAQAQVRLAGLDDYDGLVWAASNRASPQTPVSGFAQVGSKLPSRDSGRLHHVTLRVGPASAGSPWLPTVGVPDAISFSGARRQLLTDDLRYNLATDTGLLPAGLSQGDVVSLDVHDTAPPTLKELAAADPEGAPTLQPPTYAALTSAATSFSSGTSRPMDRVLAIAHKLHDGAFSDGADGVPSDPGHGIGRLATFVTGRELVGDDEQYAAAMALMANAVGVPARVALAGGVEPDGTVRGRDLRGLVELALAGRGWVSLPTDVFTPSRDKRPHIQPQQQLPEVPPMIVPPPLHAQVSLSSSAATAHSSLQPPHKRKTKRSVTVHVPGPLRAFVRWGVPPIGLLGSFVLLVLAAKALRRRRRRYSGEPSTRVANAWTEILDTARDLGVGVLPQGTRREQARALAQLPLLPLAVGADAVVFGPGDVDEQQASHYWESVLTTRRAILAELSRWRRTRVRLSFRSLLPARPTQPAQTTAAGAA